MFTLTRSAALTALILFISVFSVLGLPGIFSSSEARETHVAYIIRDTSEWILPDRNGYVPSKPLLHHWLTVCASYLTGSVSEFSARIPSAIMGIFLVLALQIFSARLFFRAYKNSEQANNLAFLTVVSLVSTYGFFSMLFVSMVDMTFSAFAVSGLLIILFSLFEQRLAGKEVIVFSQSTWCWFFICCGLATLAKGPLGLVLPCLLLAVILTSLLGFSQTCRLTLKPKWGWILYIAIALPWYLLASGKAKSAFVERQLIFENLKRFLGGDNVNYQPFWFYIPSYLSRAFPWAEIFIVVFCFFLFSKRAKNAINEISLALLRSLLVAVLFFSLSSGKRHSYLLPLFPLFSFSAVWIYSELISRTEGGANPQLFKVSKRLVNAIIGILTAVILITFVAILINPDFIQNRAELALAFRWIGSNSFRLFLVPIISLALVLITVYCKFDYRFASYAKFSFISSCLFSIITAIAAVKAEYKDYDGMASSVVSQAGSREVIAVRNRFDELLDPIFYYYLKPIKTIDLPEIVENCREGRLFMTRRSNLQTIDPKFKFTEEVVLREKVGKPSSVEARAVSLFSCQPTA